MRSSENGYERGEVERPGGRQGRGGRGGGGKGEHWGLEREGVRWDPLHINSLGIDEMIRRGLGRQS